MIIIVGQTGKKSFVREIQRLGWGRMVCRGDLLRPYPGEPWGFDNGAFSDWTHGRDFDGDAFKGRLDRAYSWGLPYLAVVPDLVGMGSASIDFSEEWREKIPQAWPWYLAVQDGMSIQDVESVIENYRGIFLGGTSAFKSTAQVWCDLAHRRGLPFHYGRCGTAAKIRHARDVGADSLDSSFPLWTEARFRFFIEMIENGHPQTGDVLMAKNPEHLGLIAGMRCIVCLKAPVSVHHIDSKRKKHDLLTIPLCMNHHQGDEGIHTIGSKTWQKRFGSEYSLLERTWGKLGSEHTKEIITALRACKGLSKRLQSHSSGELAQLLKRGD